jgi:hypothetical protein
MSNYASCYYTSYHRALIKYVNNGFFSRDLDADDIAFIEQIRERGYVACGSLGLPVPTQCTYSDDVVHRIGLEEETEFWKRPYPVDQIVVRRSGPVRQTPTRLGGQTPGAIRLRERRALVAKERADEAQRLLDRQIEQIRRDIEWEKAQPRKIGRVVKRHYVPQWKIDDDAFTANEKKRARARARAKTLRDEKASRLRTKQMRAEQQERRRILAEHRATLERLRQMEPRPAPIEPPLDARRDENSLDAMVRREHIKGQIEHINGRIVAILRDAFPNMVTLDALFLAMPDVDRELVIQCAEEMTGNGRIKKATA